MQKTVENWRKRIDMVFYFSTAQAVSEISKILPPPPPCCRTASVSPWQPKDFTPNKLWGYIYIDLPIKTGIWPIKMRTQWNVMFNQSELELLVKLAYSNQSAWGYLPHASGKQHYIYNIIQYYIYYILLGKPIWRPWRSGLISRTCQKITVFWCWPWLKLITNANRKKSSDISRSVAPPS